MNKSTQLTLLGIFAGTISVSFLLKYLWQGEQRNRHWLAELDQYLPQASAGKASDEIVEEQTTNSPQITPEPTEKQSPATGKEQKLTLPPKGDDDFPLTYGSAGPRVIRLQVWLMRNFGWRGKLSGHLDEGTLQLMKKHLKTEALDEKQYNKYRMDRPVQQQKIIR